MKIICIGQNYKAHIQELGMEIPKQPIFFCKPDTALLLKNRPFFLPNFSKEVHYETELVIKINRVGKHIQKEFAHSYYDEISLGFDFTARDLQREYSQAGLPWEICKSFDQSAALGRFIHKSELPAIQNINFGMTKNGQWAQQANTQDMLFDIDTIISYVSTFMTLKIGDYIFTGTPVGVGPVKIGDKLEAFLEINGKQESILSCDIK